MKKIIIITGLLMVLASLSGFEAAHAAEPNLADYTAYPVFMATTVEPNILIMLDNSGSMNEQAYTDEYGGSLESRSRFAREVIADIRDAVGDRADILFGTHGQMTTSSAIRLARRLEPYDPLWVEEPVPPGNAGGMVAKI